MLPAPHICIVEMCIILFLLVTEVTKCSGTHRHVQEDMMNQHFYTIRIQQTSNLLKIADYF